MLEIVDQINGRSTFFFFFEKGVIINENNSNNSKTIKTGYDNYGRILLSRVHSSETKIRLNFQGTNLISRGSYFSIGGNLGRFQVLQIQMWTQNSNL